MRLKIVALATLGALLNVTAYGQAPVERQDQRPKDPRDTVQPLPLEEARGFAVPTPPRPRAAALAPDPCAGRTDAECAFSRADLSGVRVLGTITIPGTDSRGTMINFGGAAVGFSIDGKQIMLSCRALTSAGGQDARGMVATFEIPAIGGTAKEVQPCTGLTVAQLAAISGSPGDYFPLLGGVLELPDGGILVNGFITYDAAGVYAPRKTWWRGPDLAHLAGPFEGAIRNGLAKGNTGIVPTEWRGLLGGDTYVQTGFTSIISRASYGASFSVFNAADATGPGFPMSLLLGCPYYEYPPQSYNFLTKCASRYGSPQSPIYYNGSEQSGGTFILPGTRTLVAVEREADGPTCYGYATRNPAEHGQPYLDAVYCYSLSDPLMEKGPKGYPYRLVYKLFDLADLVAVRQGRKKPWDVDPYAVGDMPDTAPGLTIGYTGGGNYNPVDARYYRVGELYPNGRGGADVTVYDGFGKGQAPAPLTVSLTASPTTVERGQPVTLTWDSPNASAADIQPGVGPVSPASGGSVQITPNDDETYRVAVSDLAGQTNAATASVTVTDPPPPAAVVCEVRSVMTPYANGDSRYTVRCYDGGDPTKALPQFFQFSVIPPAPPQMVAIPDDSWPPRMVPAPEVMVCHGYPETCVPLFRPKKP
ncbi:MAG: hypothetical protein AB7Q16_05910 [Vicinamibacterales bacterium]